MWHPGLVGGTIAAGTASVILLGTGTAGAMWGTIAWGAGAGTGIFIGSTPELIQGFNAGRTAGDSSNQAPGPLGGGPLQPVPNPTEEPL